MFGVHLRIILWTTRVIQFARIRKNSDPSYSNTRRNSQRNNDLAGSPSASTGDTMRLAGTLLAATTIFTINNHPLNAQNAPSIGGYSTASSTSSPLSQPTLSPGVLTLMELEGRFA